MSNFWIYDKVQSLITKYKTRNPIEVIQRLNIKLEVINNTKDLLGMYRVIERNRYIFISSEAGYLKNIILAHELGHDQLHRATMGKGACFHESINRTNTSIYELEANIFAAHLLIDDDKIISLIKDGHCDKSLAYEFSVDTNIVTIKIGELIKMGKIDIEPYSLNFPKSDFLKEYKPCDDEWNYG